MKIMRSATSRAKAISCVTQSMVMPLRARFFITSSTSLIISGSSAEVGSSNSMMRGSMARARAIATRCCWPPESWPGNFLACSWIPTRSSSSMPRASLSFLVFLRTQIGASVMLSSTVRCGNRLNCWKTIPVSRRMASMLRMSLVISIPSTTILPSWCSSRRLIVRMKVLLPLPEGPKTTITSPFFTRRLTSRRA